MNNKSDLFADVDLVEFMSSMGFGLNHNEGITDWFVKDEGTSELTVFGARELREYIESYAQKRYQEGELQGDIRTLKTLAAILSGTGKTVTGNQPQDEKRTTEIALSYIRNKLELRLAQEEEV